jgi:hypothetical protein
VFEQERVRLFFVLREAGAVGAVEGGEEGVFALGVSPADTDEIDRKAHGARGLVTGDTGTSVGTKRCEEGVARCLDYTGLIYEPELAGGVPEVLRGRERKPAVRIPPGIKIVAGFERAGGIDYGAWRLLLRAQPQRTQQSGAS